MKKVTVYFKSGNSVSFKAKKFNLIITGKNRENRQLIIEGVSFEWMFDLDQIECYIVKRCIF